MKYTSNYGFKKPEITDAVNIKDITDSFDKIDEKLKETQDDNTDLRSTFENLVATGLLEGGIEETLNQMEEQYAPRLTGVESQLASTAKKLNTSTAVKRPLVVFISDDAKKADVTVVAPTFEARNIPCNFAVITGKTDVDSGYLNSSEIQALKASGHGILSHSHSHVDLTTLTPEQLEADFDASQAKLKTILGEEVSGLAYPYGANNDTVVEIARKYFTHAYATGGEGYLLNEDYLDQYVIPRDVITYDTGATPRTLANIKTLIDRCKNEGKLLVYCIHASEFIGSYSANLTLLESVLDYIISIGIDVVTYDEAINEKGNVIDVGTFKTQYFKVSKSGAVNANNLYQILKHSIIFKNDDTTVTNSTPLTSFGKGIVTRTFVTAANAVGFPHGHQGTLWTYYLWDGTDYNYQIYVPSNSNYTYRRTWNRYSLVWNGWYVENQYANTTANRLTRAKVGTMYFDTTLGKPIWCKTAGVVAADGTVTTPAVWVDATGTVV